MLADDCAVQSFVVSLADRFSVVFGMHCLDTRKLLISIYQVIAGHPGCAAGTAKK